MKTKNPPHPFDNLHLRIPAADEPVKPHLYTLKELAQVIRAHPNEPLVFSAAHRLLLAARFEELEALRTAAWQVRESLAKAGH